MKGKKQQTSRIIKEFWVLVFSVLGGAVALKVALYDSSPTSPSLKVGDQIKR
jgi:lipid-A-disaccharide synthase-like uncharacterized protein